MLGLSLWDPKPRQNQSLHFVLATGNRRPQTLNLPLQGSDPSRVHFLGSLGLGLDPDWTPKSHKRAKLSIVRHSPDPRLINPFPLIGIIIGILIFRPLKGGGLLIMGLHYLSSGSRIIPSPNSEPFIPELTCESIYLQGVYIL